MTTQASIQASPKNIKLLRDAHRLAEKEEKITFVVTLDGVPRDFVTKYAYYLLEYLDSSKPI